MIVRHMFDLTDELRQEQNASWDFGFHIVFQVGKLCGRLNIREPIFHLMTSSERMQKLSIDTKYGIDMRDILFIEFLEESDMTAFRLGWEETK